MTAPEVIPVERSWPDYFIEHKKLFTPHVYKIGDHPIWSINNLDGWAANSIVIEGDDSLIVYDTGLSREHGALIADELRRISDKPVSTIFYSHHHPDHFNGTDSIVSADDVEAGRVRIYAWQNFEQERQAEFGATGPSQATKVAYYTGSLLSPEDRHHHGCCGPKYGGTPGYIPPTDLLSEDVELTISGVRIRAFYSGGEAASEFGLYLPDYQTVAVADEIFPSLPNIYTIRGAKFRDANGYLRAIDTVLALEDVEHLLGSHLVPMHGQERIRQTLTKYRDLVQYIHDQPVRYINKGYTMDELKEKFQDVPDYLENGEFSAEMYGTLEHIAPQIYAGYVGYFNGDPIEYKPTPRVEYARRTIELMGGRDAVLDAARRAFDEDDPQWAAELTTFLVRVDHDDWDARQLKAAAFRKLGYAELNTTWRSWFLTAAMELDGSLDLGQRVQQFRWVLAAPSSLNLADAMANHRYRVDADKAGATHITIGLDMTDTDERITLELRNSVLLLHEGLDASADAVLSMERQTLNAIESGEGSYAAAIADGRIAVTGDAGAAVEFWTYLDDDIFADRLVLR